MSMIDTVPGEHNVSNYIPVVKLSGTVGSNCSFTTLIITHLQW